MQYNIYVDLVEMYFILIFKEKFFNKIRVLHSTMVYIGLYAVCDNEEVNSI